MTGGTHRKLGTKLMREIRKITSHDHLSLAAWGCGSPAGPPSASGRHVYPPKPTAHFAAGGMAEEWWSTISHWSPSSHRESCNALVGASFRRPGRRQR